MNNRVIAIDGPSASGKSTVARRVAAGLGSLYVDSGALYRGVTWKALKDGVSTSDAGQVEQLLDRMDICFFKADGAIRFRIDGQELRAEIRAAVINENVSRIAAMPAVRARVTAWLRAMIQHGDIVMEGRDIGSAVFPDAACKFYLDASEEERARRRFNETESGVEKITFTAVNESLKRRDAIDKGRKVDPLKIPPGAVVVDTTGMNVEQVADFILQKLKG